MENNMSENWWKVENLKKEEAKVRSSKISELNIKGDFGSYRKVLKTDNLEDSMLEYHNDLDSKSKLLQINNLLDISPRKKFKILDVGCGMGFTTFQIKNIFRKSTVVGVDISSDATSYAKKKFTECEFICQGIEPENKIIDEFDLIYCFEFYPFTRTNDWNIHDQYIEYFLKNLKIDGLLIINHHWNNKNSLSHNYLQLNNKYQVKLYNLISKKLYHLKSFVPLFILSLIDRLIKNLRKAEDKICVIKKSGIKNA
tara:strand:+ start:346 stop:1110 length:765 start_codon:yes stop_codon:yes gene_type:complete